MIFDDGNRDVPESLEGRPERVVIVGAGPAGLTAANALRTAGVDCVVLEGRGRMGGRIDTVTIGGASVDLGAAWIHHPEGNPLTRIAEAAGVDRMSGDFRSEAVFFDPADSSVTRPEPGEVDRLVGRFFSAVHALSGRLGSDATVEEGIAVFLADLEAPRWASTVLRTLAEAEGAAPVEAMSLRSFPPSTVEFGGSPLGDFPVGGYAEILAALEGDTEVRMGSTVTEVVLRSGGVEVTVADGSSETGSHALVTVPLGVLKSGTIQFEPGLPEERTVVIDRLGFGRFEKVALAFDEAVGAGKQHLYPMGSDEFRVVMAMERFTGRPVVVATAFGASAGIIADRDEAEVVSHVMSHIREAWGPAPDPVEVIRSGWTRDPFSRGAYTFVPPGSSRDDLDELGRPVGGRVLFAGEATASARVGYVDGAFATAIREVKRLLGTPEVELTVA